MKLDEAQHRLLVNSMIEALKDARTDRREGELTAKELSEEMDIKLDTIYTWIENYIASGAMVSRKGMLDGRRTNFYSSANPSVKPKP